MRGSETSGVPAQTLANELSMKRERNPVGWLRQRSWRWTLALAVAPLAAAPLCADEVGDLLAVIERAGPQGVGSVEARAASDQLAQRGVEILPRIVEALDTPNIVAANWHRTVYERIVAAEAAKRRPEFPVRRLQDFARDPNRQGRARRLVLRLLDDLTPGYSAALLPDLLDDPEFRNDAVDHVLQRADQARSGGDLDAAQQAYQIAFDHARDAGQVTRAADRLKAAGVDVDIVRHMGFIARWHLLGPFDAPDRSGFDLEFPPQKAVDLAAAYVGQDGKKIEWTLFETDDRLGQLNLIQAIGAVKEAVGYAYAELQSPRDQDVQLRCGADDNLTVWLNGEQILARRQWLNGTRLDRFTAPASLKQGTNRVLVKICQGPQHKNPAVPNNWSLQLRFCDESGAAVGLISELPETKE